LRALATSTCRDWPDRNWQNVRAYRPQMKVILLTGGPADSRGFPLLRKPFAQSDLQRVMAEAIVDPTDRAGGKRRAGME
jgi:hypothetical protein